MHRFPSDFAFSSQSTPLTSLASSPAPPLQTPTDDAIEAVILQATSARHPSETRPLRDTRTQLFVGNLPYRVRWQDLKDLFRKAGTVLRADVSLGPDNRSRGYGTVLLATAEDAGRAVDMFNGYSWQSRVLEVRLDRLLPEYEPSSNPSVAAGSSPASAGSSSYPMASTSTHHQGPLSSFSPEELEYTLKYQSTDPASCRNLFVGNLPFHCQWQDLKDLFRQAGTILRADVALGPDGRSRGFGTVVFATEYDAEKAVRMFNGYEYNNRILKVNYDKFSQANQPVITSESPLTVNPTQAQSAYQSQMQIKLPPGFMFDYGPASGPTSPYEMFSQLQQQHQHQQRQQQQHRQQPQMLHQPQAQYYLQQQRMQPASSASPHSVYTIPSSSSSSLDIEGLTNTLASSHLSKLAQPSQRVPSAHAHAHSHGHSHKPSPISTAASSSHTSSSSEHSMVSTSASSVSQSPNPNPNPNSNPTTARQLTQSQQQHQQALQHQLQQAHQHPHHPGPIILPPLRPPIFPLSPHTPQASLGMSTTSPLHHPSMGSPYQMYATSGQGHGQGQQQGAAQMVPLTPHGLPPITPSMPPFTFLAPSLPLAPPPAFGPARAGAGGQQQQQRRRRRVSSSSKDSASSASGSSAAANPAASSSSTTGAALPSTSTIPATSTTTTTSTSTSSSAAATAENTNLAYPQHQNMPYAYGTTPNQHFVIPLPSPNLYMSSSPNLYMTSSSASASTFQHPHLPHHQQHHLPQHQQHQQHPLPSPPIHLRLNLAGLPGAFSPGVVMSPGTFYGRPGEVRPNANPFINAAVGAPVHVHSPGIAGVGVGGYSAAGGSPGGMVYPGMYANVQGQAQSHGAYFYAMSSPKKGPPSGMEPKGYFDPMYFPAGVNVGVGGLGGSALVNEVMRDRAGEGAGEKERESESQGRGSPPALTGEGDGLGSYSGPGTSVGTRTETGTEASAASSGSSLTSWYTGDVDTASSGGGELEKAGGGADAEGQRAGSSGDEEGTAGSDETVGGAAGAEAAGPSASGGLAGLDQGATISRAHSLGYQRREKKVAAAAAVPVAGAVEGPGTMTRGKSDPAHSSASAGEPGSSAAAAPPPTTTTMATTMTLRLPERVPWSRKQDAAAVHTPTARTVSASAAEYVSVQVEVGEGVLVPNEGGSDSAGQASGSSKSLPTLSSMASGAQ